MYMPISGTPPGSSTWGGWYPRGLGDAETSIKQAGGLATPVLTGALAAHAASTAAATGSAATILGMSPALAVPIIGAAVVGVTIAVIGLLKLAQGCGQTCIVTSQWANQAEELLKKNIEAYFSIPAPRPISARNAAANNYQVIVAQLQQLCSQPGTGAAGQRCISDRQGGACVWRQTADSPLLKYPGEPQPGECWNWESGYLNPIINDPNVAPDSLASEASNALQQVSALGQSPIGALALVAIAGLILWAAS